MTTIKNNLVPALLILFAGLIIGFAAVPLENTEWAESIRAGVGIGGEGGEGLAGEGQSPASVVALIGPLIKVAALMGIGALLTALGLWLIRMVRQTGSGRGEVVEGNRQ